MLKFEDITPEMIKRFWSKVKIGKNGECNDWMAFKDKNGYGRFSVTVNGKHMSIVASRFAWMIYHKQNIPEAMLICHHCDQPSCTAKNCLFLGFPSDNSKDMINKGRSGVGRKLCKERLLKLSKRSMGNKNWLGKKHTLDTKIKMSIKSKGRKLSPSAREKISIAHKKKWENIGKEENKIISSFKANHITGRKLSEKTKNKMSISKIGNKYWIGRKHSEETKAKMRASWDARKLKASRVRLFL